MYYVLCVQYIYLYKENLGGKGAYIFLVDMSAVSFFGG